MKKSIIATLAISGSFIIACGSASEPSDSDVKRLDDRVNNGVIVNSNSPTPVAKNKIEAGDWEVGKKDDIAGGVITPGKYVITAVDDGYGCYWERVKDFDGDFESILANGNVDTGKTAIVNVKSSDKGLHMDGDCLAVKKR